MAAADHKLLPGIVEALNVVHAQGPNININDFTVLVERCGAVFDMLGSVLHFAKQDIVTKVAILRQASPTLPTIVDIVAADKAAGTVTAKNSNSRCLYRLTGIVLFLRIMLEKLLQSPDMTLKDAASAAYEEALAPAHTYLVRTAAWAGMYIIPGRATFIQSIGETEDSARPNAQQFVDKSKGVTEAIYGLFDGPMPIL